MSAPTTERTRARGATIPAQRAVPTAPRRPQPAPRPAVAPPPQTGGQKSARKAYARREDRLRRLVGGRPARTTAPAGRAQFVLLVMVLLVGGLVATLWLSTAAAADSYRLQDARAEARTLSEQRAVLHREVAGAESAPELARRATALGMVPVQNPARLVVAPDGAVTLVGEPTAVSAPFVAAPPAPVAPAAPAPAAPAPADPAAGAPPPGEAAPPADPAPDGPGPAGGTDPLAAGGAADPAPTPPGAPAGTG